MWILRNIKTNNIRRALWSMDSNNVSFTEIKRIVQNKVGYNDYSFNKMQNISTNIVTTTKGIYGINDRLNRLSIPPPLTIIDKLKLIRYKKSIEVDNNIKMGKVINMKMDAIIVDTYFQMSTYINVENIELKIPMPTGPVLRHKQTILHVIHSHNGQGFPISRRLQESTDNQRQKHEDKNTMTQIKVKVANMIIKMKSLKIKHFLKTIR